MSILTVTTRITRQWLERKTKSDLAQMYIDLLDDNIRMETALKAANGGHEAEVRERTLEEAAKECERHAAFCKYEADRGGDFQHLMARHEEATYIASRVRARTALEEAMTENTWGEGAMTSERLQELARELAEDAAFYHVTPMAPTAYQAHVDRLVKDFMPLLERALAQASERPASKER